MQRSLRQEIELHLVYALELFKSLLPMLIFCGSFYTIGTLVLQSFHRGGTVSFKECMYHMYFLMLAEPTLEAPDHWLVESLVMIAPIIGIIVVFDLLARFSIHVFSKKTNQREWVNVVASTYHDHIVLCGLGKVGSKVFENLLELGERVVCIERNEEARGVREARDSGHPVIIDDARIDQTLIQAGIKKAKAVLAITNDDMVNLEVALDARKYNANIRIITRIFEQELGHKLTHGLQIDGAYSTSNLAAPFFAVSVLDPEIINSFYIKNRRYVVIQTTVTKGSWLDGQSVCHAFDTHRLAVMSCDRKGDALRVNSETVLKAGDDVCFQCSYDRYKKYRKHQKLNGVTLNKP